VVTNQDYMGRAAFALILSVVSHMLHHCQLTFYEQAFRPVPQENLSFVEQAGKPVADNGARYQLYRSDL
jgi:hypothetical protein